MAGPRSVSSVACWKANHHISRKSSADIWDCHVKQWWHHSSHLFSQSHLFIRKARLGWGTLSEVASPWPIECNSFSHGFQPSDHVFSLRRLGFRLHEVLQCLILCSQVLLHKLELKVAISLLQGANSWWHSVKETNTRPWVARTVAKREGQQLCGTSP